MVAGSTDLLAMLSSAAASERELLQAALYLLWIWLTLAAAVGIYAYKKGLWTGLYVLFSIVLSPLLGFLIALLARPEPALLVERGRRKACPNCNGLIRPDARRCRHCKQQVLDTETMPVLLPSKVGRALNLVSWVLVLTGSLLAHASLSQHAYESHQRFRLRTSAEEAQRALNSLELAISVYELSCGAAPEELQQLGPPPPGQDPRCDAEGLLDSNLASGRRGYYEFHYTPKRDPQKGIVGYEIRALPTGRYSLLLPSYFVDETGMVRKVPPGERAGPDSPIVPEPETEDKR